MHKREKTNVYQSDPYIARLIEVARAYYLNDQTQAEIARSLGISRSQVSRYLSTARKLGLVEIRIVSPEAYDATLELALRARFPHLRSVVVAPSLSDDPDAVRTMIGRFAAKLLVSVLHPGCRLALGCGRTLRSMVEALPEARVPGMAVVQAMGNIGHEAHRIDYNEIARHAAEVLGGQVYYVSAPAILGNGSGSAADLVRANPPLDFALTTARRADVYVVGIGSIESDQLYVRSGLIQAAEFDDLRGRAVGDICGRFFDLEGREQVSAFASRIIGVELADLQNASYAIGVAGGQDKVLPLLGALRGAFINAVVSDERTIQKILEVDDAMRREEKDHPLSSPQ